MRIKAIEKSLNGIGEGTVVKTVTKKAGEKFIESAAKHAEKIARIIGHMEPDGFFGPFEEGIQHSKKSNWKPGRN